MQEEELAERDPWRLLPVKSKRLGAKTENRSFSRFRTLHLAMVGISGLLTEPAQQELLQP